jgi:CheY-like chemotaxis protein/HPt (histidine-containing phosphotransfer) domain-containing protein
MDGNQLAGAIRRSPSGSSLPLIMLTSLGRRREDEESGVEFAAFMTKPIKASVLFDALVTVFADEPIPVSAPQNSEKEAEMRSLGEDNPLRILLAEDNAINQRLGLLLLEKFGYRADVASTGLEAIQAVERQPYDVVLMDVHMPEMDGLEATRQIVARWPAGERPRIIAMTANTIEGDREECMAAGMEDYVSKPIYPEQLADALRRTKPRAAKPVEAAPLLTLAQDDEEPPAPIFDPESTDRLAAHFGDTGGEVITELVGTFLTDAPTLLARAREAAEAGATEELLRAAHSLKGNAATLGAKRFSLICRELEIHGRNGDMDAALQLLPRAEHDYDAARIALEEHVDRLSGRRLTPT